MKMDDFRVAHATTILGPPPYRSQLPQTCLILSPSCGANLRLLAFLAAIHSYKSWSCKESIQVSLYVMKTSWSSEGVLLAMGVPQNHPGWFRIGKIPSTNGWWLGVALWLRKPPSGNHVTPGQNGNVVKVCCIRGNKQHPFVHYLPVWFSKCVPCPHVLCGQDTLTAFSEACLPRAGLRQECN